MNPAQIIRRYRRVSWGRLSFRSKRSKNKRFDSDDVCIVVNGVVTTHFKSMEALIRAIEEREAE